MKRQLFLIALVLILCIGLMGCENYEREDADRIAAKGAEMMQDWLAKNMPDAEITECAAFINNMEIMCWLPKRMGLRSIFPTPVHWIARNKQSQVSYKHKE